MAKGATSGRGELTTHPNMSKVANINPRTARGSSGLTTDRVQAVSRGIGLVCVVTLLAQPAFSFGVFYLPHTIFTILVIAGPSVVLIRGLRQTPEKELRRSRVNPTIPPEPFIVLGLLILLVAPYLQSSVWSAVHTAITVAFLLVGLALFLRLPGDIARSRCHPNAEAIKLCGFLGVLLFPLWLVAIIWAYTRPTQSVGSFSDRLREGGRFRITGVDRETRMDTTWYVQADNEANARAKAELEGILVTGIEIDPGDGQLV